MPSEPLVTQAEDCFALGQPFAAIHAARGPETELVRASLADGAWGLWRTVRPRTRVLTRYHYGGTDLRAAIPWHLGQVLGGWKLDRLRLDLRLHEPVLLELLGHNHAEAPHEAPGAGVSPGFGLELASLLPAGLGPWGLPEGAPWSDGESGAALQRLLLSFELEHEDAWDASGAHLTGADWAGELRVRADYLGEPALELSGWHAARITHPSGSQDFGRTRLHLWRPLARVSPA